jgi:hypothetical protein
VVQFRLFMRFYTGFLRWQAGVIGFFLPRTLIE